MIFMDMSIRPKQIGRTRRYSDDSLIFEMLRRARASLETVNLVENALREQRCCMVVLDLTDEQFQKLQTHR